MQWSSTSSSTRLSYSAVTAACSAWRSTTISAPWHARTDAYSAAVGNTGSAVSDDGDARVGLSDKLDVLVVARLLLQLGAGRAGQLGVDRGRGVGGLLRRAAARAGVPIGRASCRERVCQYVLIPVVDVSIKKKK